MLGTNSSRTLCAVGCTFVSFLWKPFGLHLGQADTRAELLDRSLLWVESPGRRSDREQVVVC